MSILTDTAVWILLLSFSQLHVLGQDVNECKYRDKAEIFNPFSPSMTNIQILDSRFTINRFPCGFKLANYQCGKVQTVVSVENSLYKNGLTFLSDVTVTLTTVKKGNATHQILKLSTIKLKKYIAQGKFSKSPWRWSYDGVRPKSRHRISGSYNQSTWTAVVASGGVEVTFTTARTLIARCSDSNFKVYEGFAEGVYCGYPNSTWTDVNRMYNDMSKQMPSDYHHRGNFENDYISLVKQKEYHTTPLCKEATSILASGQCDNLGDKVYECYQLYRKPIPLLVTGYGECIRNNSIDPFKVYVACLRALCKTSGCDSNDTCDTLRNVALTCRHVQPWHANMTTILARTDCQPLPVTTTTTIATTASTTAAPPTTTVMGFPTSDTALKAGAACNETSDCGINMLCSGDPAQCTCTPGYSSKHGHCGKTWKQSCSNTTDCLPLMYCSLYARCQCRSGSWHDQQGFCYTRVGEACGSDEDCSNNAKCVNGSCACNANAVADMDKSRLSDSNNGRNTLLTDCYLKLDEACTDTSQCGVNTECTGSPGKCTCLPGYIMDKGRCGKPVGDNCGSQSKHRRCVLHASCRYETCQCTSVGYGAAGQICEKRATCTYEQTVSPALTVFPANGEQDILSNYHVFPCSYKMANIQCGSGQTVITVDNDVDKGYRFGRKFMANVTVNITSVNSMGAATSQINRLHIGKLLEMQATGDYNMTIWDWTFSGPEEPDQASRITGHYDRARWTAYLAAGQLAVNLTDGGTVLTIACSDPDYSAFEDWPHTLCGGPNNKNIYQTYREDGFHMITDRHHLENDQKGGVRDIIALIKQSVQQSKPICHEATSIAQSTCADMGDKLYRIRNALVTFDRCMEVAKLDQFELYVASLRTLCGVPGTNPELDVCHLFREVAGHCRVDADHLHMVQLLNMAGCNPTFSTTTTAKAPRFWWWK
ncbi:uncharacterized protein [Littorina saxatilis]|uniref:uncharacterized protein isoform X2 n=1 Tax=Littorina saxatilis TaxID=31220 RepID=UPI0038B6513A